MGTLAVKGVAQPRTAAAFAALIAVGELARVRLPGDRESAPLAEAGGLAYALVLSVGTAPAVQGPFQVVVVTAAGTLVGVAPHAATRQPLHAAGMARRVLTVAVAALLLRHFTYALSPVFNKSWLTLGVLVGVLLVAGAARLLLAAGVRAGKLGARFLPIVRDEFRARLPLDSAIAASALLVALAAHVTDLYALIVCVAPLVVTQVAYRRYAGIRATYLQTIRSLSRVTEVGGYVREGHGRRVRDLAIRIGRELGLREPDLLQLEYAALMHDIGQLSLHEPVPGGATVGVTPQQQRRIAGLGAKVIREAGVLDRVADIVELQAEPYQKPSSERAGDPAEERRPPLRSRIIRVANAYDDLTAGERGMHSSQAALDRIRLGSLRDYDPRVVCALGRVLESADTIPDADWAVKQRKSAWDNLAQPS